MSKEAGFLRILADKGFIVRCYRDVLDTVTVIKDEQVVAKDEDYMGHMLHCFETVRYKFAQENICMEYAAQWEEEAAQQILVFFGWHPDRKVQLKKVGEGYTWTFEWKNGGSFSVWRKDCAKGFEEGMEIIKKTGMLI